jgi:N-acetylmuramic acid 6-phosphate etherase
VVYEGSGGPGNPLTADPHTVRTSYRVALAGCPAAARVAACVSGTGGQAQRDQIAGLLAARFPGADIQVAPDYVAAFLAAPEGTAACVVAGTGSVVCSRAADGSYRASGGRTVFLGAGTSGRIALQEAAELPPTFGVPQESFTVMAAGGALMGPTAITQDEDDVLAAPDALSAMRIGPGDAVIGLAASGTTPFVRAGLQAAARARAWTCGIAHNPGAPLLHDGELGILLDTGPEVLTGSTRLKAGTAQKLALNRITTAAMVLAGRVAGNHMIDLTGSTRKLRARAVRIVMDLGVLDEPDARQRLKAARWSVRAALRSPGPPARGAQL